MDIEQPALGNVGPVSIALTLDWSWDRGWRCRLASRPSGARAWRKHCYEGRDEAELHAAISDHLADLLGLV